jgi:hypothetical protein
MNWHDIEGSALWRHKVDEMTNRTPNNAYYYPNEVGAG